MNYLLILFNNYSFHLTETRKYAEVFIKNNIKHTWRFYGLPISYLNAANGRPVVDESIRKCRKKSSRAFPGGLECLTCYSKNREKNGGDTTLVANNTAGWEIEGG